MSEDVPPYLVSPAGACPFCGVDQGRIAWSSALAIVLWDIFPVSLGHALILPRRRMLGASGLRRVAEPPPPEYRP